MLPFTQAQFFAVFAEYNAAVWPAQVVAYLLGVAAMFLLIRPTAWSGRALGVGLGVLWLWTGVAYHGLHFAAINRAALAFAALFVVQGLALLAAGALGRLHFDRRGGVNAWVGWFLIVYAMAVYPLIGVAFGHTAIELPAFGITPCPLTIFTFGVLLLATPPLPWWVLAVPLVWSLIGGSAAFLLRVPQDWLLLFSGLGVATWLYRARSRGTAMSAPRAAGH